MKTILIFILSTFSLWNDVQASQNSIDCSEKFNGYWQSIRECVFNNIDSLTNDLNKLRKSGDVAELKPIIRERCEKNAEKYEGELNKHFYYNCYQNELEGYITAYRIDLKSRVSSLLQSTALNCQVTIKKPIQFYDSGELRLDVDWQTYVTKELGWDSSFPYTAIDGACSAKIKDSMFSIYEGNSVPKENIGYYFFQIKESETGYTINWNGSRKYSHAQWNITENAELALKEGDVCLSHPAVQMCFSDSN